MGETKKTKVRSCLEHSPISICHLLSVLFNDGLAPVVAEKKLKSVSGMT
jgi:hypothetical protein